LQTYHACFPNDLFGNCSFELLGIDILLEKKENGVKAWLLEVNHSPSLNVDTPIDKELKSRLVLDVLRIANLKGNLIRRNNLTEKVSRTDQLSKGSKPEKKDMEKIKQNIDAVAESEMKDVSNTLFDLIYPEKEAETYQKFYVMCSTVPGK
jgi:hypothetical protein